jgi:1-acyl-sn-glycerol-3-phosphate acyltransferase
MKNILLVLRGILGIVLLGLNGIITPWPVIFCGILRGIAPKKWQPKFDAINYNYLIPLWVKINTLVTSKILRIKIKCEGVGKLNKMGRYFISSNHQSWADILVLQQALHGKIPIFAFFLKKQLRWSIPIIGWACWAGGHPFMQRMNKSALEKSSLKKYHDIEMTQRFCQRFKHQPICIVSFLESTRFSEEKKHQQHSPYRYLLKPKATTLAYVIQNYGDTIQEIIDVSIIYHTQNKISFWNFLCGKINSVLVHYEIIPISEELRGDYENDRNFRVQFQAWLNGVWAKKDLLIAKENLKPE